MTQTRLLAPLAALAALALAACDKTETKTVEVPVSPPDSTYLVEYLPGDVDAAVGKTSFQLRVRRRADFTAASGLAITLAPVMTMTGMSHGSPVDVVVESATPGTYDCTVYYLMASGVGMGYWELTATVAGEQHTFYPSVGMAMGQTTVRQTLWGAADAGMSEMAANKYFLFRDGPVTVADGRLPLFLSRAQDMLMTFKPVSMGTVLAAPVGEVTSFAFTAAADPAFTTPITAADHGGGHYTFDVSSLGLAAGTEAVLYVKLAVNGEAKTMTDGSTNTYATFRFTPQ